MILEIATIDVIPGSEAEYITAFNRAKELLPKNSGYISHELRRCLEMPSRFLVMIKWQSLDDHMLGFRQSEDFLKWRALIGPFFNSPPDIKHYEIV